ncbi:hypothetical protein [Thermomonospora umbrina]|uniref:Uncharacterized protein n=1 Tax=Thermomonospora umbrina TaxID=111806 RepID=A0A3D9SST9_9ACTN|nr:hypothetical protein [Thermomonospora umbrina]REE95624.1 hypothetical protein DFJ69_1028 [Thermomonospora umbrina]
MAEYPEDVETGAFDLSGVTLGEVLTLRDVGSPGALDKILEWPGDIPDPLFGGSNGVAGSGH